MEYRHELKFQMSDLDMVRLKHRLEPLMSLDPNQQNEFYTIRSLYFDDFSDSCFSENLAGVDRRSKYRIRLYEDHTDYINLEKKSKLHGMTKKESERLDLSQVLPYIDGTSELTAGPLTTELFIKQQSQGLAPKCVVEYERCAFTEEAGNVRVTFDTNIRGSLDVDRFLDFSEDFMMPSTEPGMHILEIKYDEFLPTYIREAVDLNNLLRQSFSKYAQVRRIFS